MPDEEEATRGQQSGKDRIIDQFLGEGGGATSDVFLTVGRIGDNQVELPGLGRQLGKGHEDVLHPQGHGRGWQPGGCQVLPVEPGVFLRHLDADHLLGAPAQAFQTQGTATGEQVQDPCAVEKRPQAVENRQLDLVRGGPDPEALGNLEQPSGCQTANDTHGPRLVERGVGASSHSDQEETNP